jgi:hypothetical protein
VPRRAFSACERRGRASAWRRVSQPEAKQLAQIAAMIKAVRELGMET